MLWVFAYGSLMFRPAFPFAAREPAFIEGFERRFWQGSTDHRGVPGAPGRVVTLMPSAGARCFGVAFGVADADASTVLDGLDFRERGGYSRLELPLLRTSDSTLVSTGLVYVANPDNENWLGPATIDDIAMQVRTSVGPSGRNVDYVIGVARALVDIGAVDEHVFDIADRAEPGWRIPARHTARDASAGCALVA
ncbi:MAG: gamma-glutamylcyclotransferase [Polyangiaceae bacterium]|nr:gamma-glutamylcyclotransferase [Polyangiaceae bacterium]